MLTHQESVNGARYESHYWVQPPRQTLPTIPAACVAGRGSRFRMLASNRDPDLSDSGTHVDRSDGLRSGGARGGVGGGHVGGLILPQVLGDAPCGLLLLMRLRPNRGLVPARGVDLPAGGL